MPRFNNSHITQPFQHNFGIPRHISTFRNGRPPKAFAYLRTKKSYLRITVSCLNLVLSYEKKLFFHFHSSNVHSKLLNLSQLSSISFRTQHTKALIYAYISTIAYFFHLIHSVPSDDLECS